MVAARLHAHPFRVASVRTQARPAHHRLRGDQLLQRAQRRLVLPRLHQGRSQAVGPQRHAAPAQRRQRIEHRHGAHHGQRLARPPAGAEAREHGLDPGGEDVVRQRAAQPRRHRPALQQSRRRLRVLRHGQRQAARAPDLHRPDGEAALRRARHAHDRTPGAGRGRVAQQGGRGPVLRVLGQHAAQQVGERGRQRLASDQGVVAAKLHLAAQDRGVVEPGERRASQRQGQQHHAERIDVVGDGAWSAPRPEAELGGGRLEQGGLQAGGRLGPGRAEHHVAAVVAEQVVGPDRAVGLAELRQRGEHGSRGAQHPGEQLGFGPRRGGGQGRPGRRRNHHPGRAGEHAMGKRRQQPRDRRLREGEDRAGARRRGRQHTPRRQPSLRAEAAVARPHGAQVGRQELGRAVGFGDVAPGDGRASRL